MFGLYLIYVMCVVCTMFMYIASNISKKKKQRTDGFEREEWEMRMTFRVLWSFWQTSISKYMWNMFRSKKSTWIRKNAIFVVIKNIISKSTWIHWSDFRSLLIFSQHWYIFNSQHVYLRCFYCCSWNFFQNQFFFVYNN